MGRLLFGHLLTLFFMEAALKCRRRRKLWLQNLQAKVEYLTVDNEQLQIQAETLREEVINFKTLLLAHKDCPVNQQETYEAIRRPLPAYERHLPSANTMQENTTGKQRRRQQRQQMLTALTSQPSEGPAPTMNA